MKRICTLVFALVLFAAASPAQNAPARTDLYHVHVAKAALGKGAELGEYLKTADPNVPMSAHHIVLRHQDGEDWDTRSSSIWEPRPPWKPLAPQCPRPCVTWYAWHTDSFVNGPAWADFTKALGIDEGSASKSSGSVYVVSVYRAAPGHREHLEKSLTQNPRNDTSAGTVLMQHVEGGPWTYVTVVRYASWQDFATTEKNGVADTLKPDGGWLGLREYSTYHNDTLTDRIAP